MSFSVVRYLVVFGLLILAFGCSREVEKPAADLLRHVPADTPYVFVNSRHLPDALRARLADYYAAQLASQRASLAQLRKQIEASEDTAPMADAARQAFAVMDALLAEFEGRDTAEKVRELGIEPVTRSVLYGIGLLPAMRVEIADAQRLNAMLDRVEQRAGVSAARGELDGQAYRRIDLGKIDAVLAVADRYAIAGLLPDTLFDRDLPLLLGQQTPAESLADKGLLTDIIKTHGFTGYGEGFIDLRGLVATVAGKGAGRNLETLQAIELPPPPLSDGCLRLTGDLVAGMPRMVMGITSADAQQMTVRGVWESTPAVAAHLQRLAAPVPGVGGPYDGLLAFGMGIDLPQLRNAVEALLQTILAAGASCEWVDPAELQAVIPRLNLALGPMTAGIHGFNLLLDDLVFDPELMQPSEVRGGLLAAVDDPRGVFALGAMFNPALAALQVPQDGTFVDLPSDLGMGAETPPMKVAIKDKSLLLLAGRDAGALADTLLGAVPTSPAPLLAFDYGVYQLVERFGRTIEAAADRMASAGDPSTAADLRAQLDGFRLQAELFDRLRVALYANDKGLVMDQEMRLRQ